ncbi:MAG TPA: type II toxin-antitoxin system RelE/ParE family toxin [Terracidiphilus sp.]|jgi:toxin ParE1/3/4
MKYRILVTDDALRDLDDLYEWVAEHDSPQKAEYVFNRITETVKGIAVLPHRGSRPRELPPGLHAEYRQVLFKPYRVIYEVVEPDIVVHMIADGRRNLQSLLLRRLTAE